MNRPLGRDAFASSLRGKSGDFFAAFRSALATRPGDTAIVHYATARKTVEFTFADLAAAAARRAAALAEAAAPGDMVFILQDDVAEQMLWWLGAAAAGMVPGILTPPTPKLPRDKYLADLAAILAAYPTAAVVAGPVLAAEELPDRRLHVADALLSALPADAGFPFEVAARPAGAPLVFQQSSGTTGLRKGVLLTEAAVCAQLKAYGQAIAVGQRDVIVSWLPLYHDMGFVACFLGALYWGVPLVKTSPFVWLRRPDWLFDAIARHGGTLCWQPNFALNVMADRIDPAGQPGTALSGLRLLVNCSEPVLASSTDRFFARFAGNGLALTALSSCYAMAENVFAVTQTAPGAQVVTETVDIERLNRESVAVPSAEGRRLASSGRVIGGTEVRIARAGAPCAEGEVGGIEVRGDSRMASYFGIGAEAAAVDADGWFRTGDLGYLRRGELFVIGRSKDIIIRAGRNIDPACLEAAAGAVEGVKSGRVVAFAVANEAEGTDDIVVLAETEGALALEDTQALREQVARACYIEAGQVPQAVRLLDAGWLLKSSSGKISRALCREKYLNMLADEEVAR
jgi:fatty-acyl-CoA synthase